MIVLCLQQPHFFNSSLFSHSVHIIHTQNGRDDDGGDYTFVYIHISVQTLSKGAKTFPTNLLLGKFSSQKII